MPPCLLFFALVEMWEQVTWSKFLKASRHAHIGGEKLKVRTRYYKIIPKRRGEFTLDFVNLCYTSCLRLNFPYQGDLLRVQRTPVQSLWAPQHPQRFARIACANVGMAMVVAVTCYKSGNRMGMTGWVHKGFRAKGMSTLMVFRW